MGCVVGTALPSIMSILAGASEVCITDHPSSPALASGATQENVQIGLDLAKSRNTSPLVSLNAHEWGSVTDAFSEEHGGHYTKIIAADCLWMASQHRLLVHTIAHFLSRKSPHACALVVAGFHTGRRVVADFFNQFSKSDEVDDAVEQLNLSEIYEIDMNGQRRPWNESRTNEGKEELSGWCVVAVIVRRGMSSPRAPNTDIQAGTPPQ